MFLLKKKKADTIENGFDGRKEADVQTREESPTATRAQFSKVGNQKRFFPEERERAFPVFLTTEAKAGRKALDHGDMT
jgi:hypothetical protein